MALPKLYWYFAMDDRTRTSRAHSFGCDDGEIQRHAKGRTSACLASDVRILQEARDIDDSLRWESKGLLRFYMGQRGLYPDAVKLGEALPTKSMLQYRERGNAVQLNMFCDASPATDLITRRSTTGILFFMNGAPVKWYSKSQNAIES